MQARECEIRQRHTESVLRFAPLDLPVAIIADDSALLNAATANFADLAGRTDNRAPKIVIRLRRDELATPTVGFTVSAKGSCLALEGDGVSGWADASTGTADASLANDCDAADVGETLLLFLLTRAGRTPVHAASVVIGKTAVLLAGPSGSGKSSLALAAQRLGLEVLSEDTTYVELEPALRIWGWPGAIHLHPSDAPAGEFPQRRRGGRIKTAVSRIPAQSFAKRAVFVALERGGKVGLDQVDPDWLIARLPAVEPGFDLLRPQVEQAVAAVAQGGAWRLTLSRSPDDAIAILRERFAHM